ncbi:AAA family ATPase [Bacteroides uniformis]|uniref:AAA family ATPase n=1 Tax=Bacteroides uniformis TaxID=820 RepID=UPI00398427FC
MGQSLNEIAQVLRDTDKKVQLIYAFNGVGKTRLSREFKELIAPKGHGSENEDAKVKVLYYNAFTEDLFYWDNDLNEDTNRKLIIRPNGFTNWVLKDQGQEPNIIRHFQHYTNDKLTPSFNEEYNEISFSIEAGNEEIVDNIKISKGEESCLIWCVFYSLLEQVVEVLNIAELRDRETDQFNDLKSVFIDDPVSSLDENHLIELAVNIAELIKSSQSELKFIITTHNPMFYNVLYNELELKKKNKKGNECCYLLDKKDDGTYELIGKSGDSNKNFSYHLHLISVLQKAVDENQIEKFHFMLLRNLYEKTANFLGYTQWSDLLPDDKKTYYNRVIQFTSHSTLSNEAVSEPTEPEKNTLKLLLKHLVENNYYTKNKEQNGTI